MRAVVSGGCRVDWLLVVAKQTNKPITLVCNYSGLGSGTQLTRSGSEGAMSPCHITYILHVSQGQGRRELDANGQSQVGGKNDNSHSR